MLTATVRVLTNLGFWNESYPIVPISTKAEYDIPKQQLAEQLLTYVGTYHKTGTGLSGRAYQYEQFGC